MMAGVDDRKHRMVQWYVELPVMSATRTRPSLQSGDILPFMAAGPRVQ